MPPPASDRREPPDQRRGPPRARKDPDRIAAWRVDPSGVYPFRFHNGRRWTEVVLTWEGRIRRGAC
jgi:hypothetical protein